MTPYTPEQLEQLLSKLPDPSGASKVRKNLSRVFFWRAYGGMVSGASFLVALAVGTTAVFVNQGQPLPALEQKAGYSTTELRATEVPVSPVPTDGMVTPVPTNMPQITLPPTGGGGTTSGEQVIRSDAPSDVNNSVNMGADRPMTASGSEAGSGYGNDTRGYAQP